MVNFIALPKVQPDEPEAMRYSTIILVCLGAIIMMILVTIKILSDKSQKGQYIIGSSEEPGRSSV